jgi:glutathione transport system permease protein
VLRYLIRRLLLLPLTLLGVATLSFLLLRVIPGDPAVQLAGDTARKQDIDLLRHQLGLDRSLGHQYLAYLGDLATGNLGRSFRTRTSVFHQETSTIGPTLTLGFAATLLTVLLGFPAGAAAAYWRGKLVDRAIFAAGILGLSLPNFWIGLVLIWLFSVKVHWFPVSGDEGLRSLILPTLSLALGPIAIMARTVRSSMVDALDEDYVRTARSKGLRELSVVGHALRNTLIPAVTLVGLNFGTLLAGAVLVEIVFTWPGMGRLLVDALEYRDFPVIQGVTVTFAAIFLIANIVVDVLYAAIDPRIAHG